MLTGTGSNRGIHPDSNPTSTGNPTLHPSGIQPHIRQEFNPASIGNPTPHPSGMQPHIHPTSAQGTLSIPWDLSVNLWIPQNHPGSLHIPQDTLCIPWDVSVSPGSLGIAAPSCPSQLLLSDPPRSLDPPGSPRLPWCQAPAVPPSAARAPW